MNTKSIEELEAELARQDQALERSMAMFEEGLANNPNARFDVPTSFFEELAEQCKPRVAIPTQFVFGLRA